MTRKFTKDPSVTRARAAEKIHTQEELIEIADRLKIDRTWYSFDGDRTKQVTLRGNTVFYGESGECICGSGYGQYDLMLSELLTYKKYYEYVNSTDRYKIVSVHAMYRGSIKRYDKELKKALVEVSTESQAESEILLKNGWLYDGYNQRDEYYMHSKLFGDEMLEGISVVFEKKTDLRDKKNFGFTEDSLVASVALPVPEKIRADIFYDIAGYPDRSYLPKGVVSDTLAIQIIEASGGMDFILEQEYLNLIKYSDLVRARLHSAAEKYLADKKGSAYCRDSYQRYIEKESEEEKKFDCPYKKSRQNQIFHTLFDETEKIMQSASL